MKCTFVIACGLAASTTLGAVDLVAQARYVRENGFEAGPGGIVPYSHIDAAATFGAFAGAYTYASQDSLLDAAYFSGSGMASGLPGSAMNPHPFTGRSYLMVVFTVPFEQTYSLTGTLTGSNLNPISTVSSFMSLTGPGLAIDRRSYLEPGPFSYAGTLAPGEYTLTCDARVDEFEGSFVQPATWAFSFRAVPAPGAMTLLVATGLLARRRRR